MLNWDSSEGERASIGSLPILVPSEGTLLPNQPPQSQPVVVPNVQGLKQQFSQQQSLLTEMKATLRENDADRASKEKQLKIFEKKLSLIKNRQKSSPKQSEFNSSTQNLTTKDSLGGSQAKSSVDILSERNIRYNEKKIELQKRLEENKIKLKEKTEHGITETKKIESIMEDLRTQVLRSDATIQELQKNIDVPPIKLKAMPRQNQKRSKEHILNISKWTQTQNADPNTVNPRVQELEATISELRDTIKNQMSVIDANKRAANLLSNDLNKKEIIKTNELESIKSEMLIMQSNFDAIETKLKADLNERNNRIANLDEQLDSLEFKNGELAILNIDNEKKILGLMTEREVLEKNVCDLSKNCFVPVDPHSVETGKLEDKIAELTKELDESNKLMIRLKLEHKNKLKTANKALEKLKQSSNDKSDDRTYQKNEELLGVISKLEEKVTDLEDEKGNLLLSLLDYDDLKVTILADKGIMLDEITSKNEEITQLRIAIDELEKEKKVLLQNVDDLNMLVDNLNGANSAELECFQVPGDSVSRQFDISNESVQNQIGNLVKEKQQLMEKLKNLAGAETFSIVPADHELTHAESAVDIVDTSQMGSDVIKPADRKGSNNLKNKIKKLELELKKEREHVEALNMTIKVNEQQLQALNERIANLENDSSLAPDNIDVFETQHACLSLENLLMQKTQQCEHLRRENLEVVHQLSEEKVLRSRAEEEVEDIDKLLQQTIALNTRIIALEDGIAELKMSLQRKDVDDFDRANIVIASKDTEIFNLENALADKTEKLEKVYDELTIFHQNIENVLQNSANIGNLRNLSKQVQCSLTKQLIDIFAEKDNKLIELDNYINDQCAAYKIKVKELSDMLKAHENENEILKEEKHRLQVFLESSLSESKLMTHERDIKINELTKILHEVQSQLQNQEILIRQRDEAFLKAEETEKVLQSTWAERNDLIQSRDYICQQLNDTERSRAAITKENDSSRSECDMLRKSLEQMQIERDLNLLQSKQQELDSMTIKAKKLAVNLKKKTQIEKDLLHQVSLLTAEKDATSSKSLELNEIFEKFQEEQQKNEQYVNLQNELIIEKQHLIEENKKLIGEKELILQQFQGINLQDVKDLKMEQERVISELQTVINEKAALEQLINVEKLALIESNKMRDSLIDQNNYLKQNLDSVHEKWTLEVSEKECAVQHKNELHETLVTTKIALDELENEKKVFETERIAIIQEKDQLYYQCKSLQAGLENLKKENYNLINEIDNLKLRCESLVVLETENKALIEKLSELSLEKGNLEKELKSNENQVSINDGRINDLSVSITNLQGMLASLQEEKTKMEEQWAEFGVKSSHEVDKYVNTISQLEKQVNNFNIAFDAEVQKNNALKAELEENKQSNDRLKSEILRLGDISQSPDEKMERKKKKSVTFRTDDTDIIKEQRGEIATLQRALEDSNATVDELKSALEKEKVDTGIIDDNIQTIPKTFDVNLFEEPATSQFFFDSSNPEPSDPFNEESLTWDDGWGADGHLEAEHQAISQKPTNESIKITQLESDIKTLYAEKESLLEDHRVLQVKYTKLIKKLKEQKLVIDRLQTDLRTKSSSDSSSLDEAIIEELRAEIKKLETRELDMRKEVDSLKMEKESLLKNIDVLSAGNDRFLEMKERQDNDAALWISKQTELRTKVAELQSQLNAPTPDETQIALENRDLKNLIEGLEWKVSELTEMVEEKDEEIERYVSRSQEKGQSLDAGLLEITNEKLKDTEQQLSLLVAENDTLQAILNNQKFESQAITSNLAPDFLSQPSALSQLFPTDPNQPAFPSFHEILDQQVAPSKNISTDPHIYTIELQELKQLILTKDEDIQKILVELENERLAFETEKELLLNKLSEKDNEIVKLSQMAANAEISYNECKIELERFVEESRLRSDTHLEEELNEVRRSLEAKYQSLLKSRDAELESLRYSLGSNERDLNETQMTNDEFVKKLKEQLRELDASSTRALEEKEIENRELSAESAELRELCHFQENEIRQIQTELSSASDAFKSKHTENNTNCSLLEKSQSELINVKDSLAEVTSKYQQLQALLEERESELAHISQTKENTVETLEKSSAVDVLTQQSTKDCQLEELISALAVRDTEIQELRRTLQTMHDEITHFRNFDSQLREIRLKEDSQSTGERTEVDWSGQEANNLSKLLESDLDNALYLLHQRDVRCDELTFELTQLLEERDALQLRLSAEIRKNAELANSTMMTHSHSHQTQSGREAEGQLAHKLSELHTIEYGRDINIQDDTVQRYRDQMDLLSRDGRLKAHTVYDV